MATNDSYQDFYDKFSAIVSEAVSNLGSDLIANPQLAELLSNRLKKQFHDSFNEVNRREPPSSDRGLAGLIGIGPDAIDDLGKATLPPTVEAYDDSITSERILTASDLYYVYQHEKVGVFRSVAKLQEVFRSGEIRLSDGPGAIALYQFDRKQTLRFSQNDRLQAYRRLFGYTRVPLTGLATPNTEFHSLFVNFTTQVALFNEAKRVTEVIRPRTTDPSYGSIARVRRAGLDVRNNLKSATYGHIQVLRTEVMQLLDEAFRILSADDVKKLFGADSAWDVLEEIMRRYFEKPVINASRLSRLAMSGREVLQWLAAPYLTAARNRTEFEALILQIADAVEEWLTSAQTMGLTDLRSSRSKGSSQDNVVPLRRA